MATLVKRLRDYRERMYVTEDSPVYQMLGDAIRLENAARALLDEIRLEMESGNPAILRAYKIEDALETLSRALNATNSKSSAEGVKE